MSDEKIQVREGWWRQRCGNVVRIAGESGVSDYPWRCLAGHFYRDDGRYFSGKKTECDLVEFFGRNITITSADIDIPELRVPMLFWVCPGCRGSVLIWRRGVATCDNCGQTSVDCDQ